ncbi:helix-turn-helix domain-containing protein [Rhodococcus qingshengii]|nr:helix-turn-helix domain-containing protein [Rhodococcus qingshengii]
MKVRSTLIITLCELADAWQRPAAEAANRFGITVPRVAEMKIGRIDRFTIDELLAIATKVGIRAQLTLTE